MTLRVSIYKLKFWGALGVLMLLAACTPQDQEVSNDKVNLMVRAAVAVSNETSSSLPAKETNIYDLSVFIFNAQGETISFVSKTFDNGVANSIAIQTRQATGCTLVVIANALKLNGGNSPFAGISTLSDLKTTYLRFANVEAISSSDCLLMVGQQSGFTTSAAKTTVMLKRLASRIDYTLHVKDDASGHPIVIDSYQLCQVPMTSFYLPVDMSNVSLPSTNTYGAFSEVNTPIASWSSTPEATYTNYVYANPATDQTSSTYLLVKAHSQASSSDTQKVWEAEYKVYLQGIAGLADYKVLPNYHYSIDVTIQGASSATNGVISSYKAYPYIFFTADLTDWNEENRPQDM